MNDRLCLHPDVAEMGGNHPCSPKTRVQEEGLRKTMPTVKEEKNASRVRKTGLARGLL